jgi:predicted AAA+ superfamily ATPase
MDYIKRAIEPLLQETLKRGRSILLLGPRQTGKTTLLERIPCQYSLSFIQPPIRQKYERHLALLTQEIEALPRHDPSKQPLVVLDEVQKIPDVMDVAQDLIDRRKAQFILTGSSARRLRRAHANLLPGRVVSFHMDPLTLEEYPKASLEDRLLYGSLPILYQSVDPMSRETDLESYVTTYLEEEVRAEALVRNLGTFGRFLELAAAEAGAIVNFRKLSQKIGVSHTTLMDYYQILEDCLLAERVEPYTESKTRKKLTRSQRYLFFDLGVRRAAAKEGTRLPQSSWGILFEQWVGLELLRLMRLLQPKPSLHFWRDPAGPEIDWLIRREKQLIPIEVKWTETPAPDDIKHLTIFLKEYPQASTGYIVCRTSRRLKLTENIFALPWQDIPSLLI